MRRLSLLLALVLAALPRAVSAQTGATLILHDLQTEAFPFITGYFDARDANGTLIEDIQAAELQALEDGTPQPVQEVRSVDASLRIIVALDPAESFNIRNSQAQTRFDLVRQDMQAWATGLPSTSSTLLSLITPEGVLAQDALASEWSAAFDSYVLPDAMAADTQSLAQAIDLASQPAADPSTVTAIWWLTATLPQAAMASLPDWQTALAAQGVPVFIWQVDSPSTFTSEASQTLFAFAQASGGQLSAFSGVEALPKPEDYFTPLRHVYFFQYSSKLRTAGEHTIALQLQRQDIAASSAPATINLDIRPPNPILVSPPTQIQRAPSEQDPQLLSPFSQPIEIVVEFPDGFERNLVRSTLYVNDEPVAVNSTAPFNHFAWDLSDLTESQQVFLRVDVEDELGLVGTSIQFPVDVSVQAPLDWFQGLLARGGATLALSVVLISAGAFFLVMVLSGRIDSTLLSRRFSRPAAVGVPRSADPLHDAPAGLDASGPSVNATVNHSPKPGPVAPAYLQRLTVQDPNQAAVVQPINGDELLIGKGAACNLVLPDDSVEAEHARIALAENGEYHLFDLGSHAGTWVNYAPVSPSGSRLRDGDIIHVGRVPFRFLMNHEANNE